MRTTRSTFILSIKTVLFFLFMLQAAQMQWWWMCSEQHVCMFTGGVITQMLVNSKLKEQSLCSIGMVCEFRGHKSDARGSENPHPNVSVLGREPNYWPWLVNINTHVSNFQNRLAEKTNYGEDLPFLKHFFFNPLRLTLTFLGHRGTSGAELNSAESNLSDWANDTIL